MNKKLRHLELELSQDALSSLNVALQKFEGSVLEDEQDILSLGKKVVSSLPSDFIDALKEISKNKSDVASLIVHRLPIERPNGFSKTDKNSELILAALVHIVGRAFVAPYHRDGKALLNLIPKKADAGKQLSTGVELEWHTEDAHLSHPARFICLLGLRGDTQAKTLISDINIATVDEKWLSLFSKKEYIIRSDESYRQAYRETTALINEDDRDLYHLRYDPSFTDFTSDEYADASQRLKILLEENNKAFQLDTGDLLIFNNKISSHKRSDFNPSYSGTDRWIQRIMLS